MRASARLWFCTGAFVRSRIERIVEPSFVIKDGWAERFWTVIVSKDAAMRRATEAQVSLATQRLKLTLNRRRAISPLPARERRGRMLINLMIPRRCRSQPGTTLAL